MLYELRRGGEWENNRGNVSLRVFLHIICRNKGSAAIWLDEMGVLMTRDPDEVKKNFPYDEWLNEAKLTLDLYKKT